MARPLDNTLYLGLNRTLSFERTLLLVLVLVALLLSSCGLPGMGDDSGSNSTPQFIETPVASVHSSFRTFRACLDITGSYPQNFLDEAKQLLANSIDQTIVPGSQGMTGYIGWIDSSSWNADALVITVPAVAPDPEYKAPGNIFNKSQWQSDYQNKLHQNHLNWYTTQQQVQRETDALRTLKPGKNPDGSTPSPNGTSVYGCIGRASSQLQNVQGDRYLFIASDLEENAYTEVLSHISLIGVKVRVIFFHCSSDFPAPRCEQKTNFWKQKFAQFGITDYEFFDYQQSMSMLLQKQSLFS